MDTSRKNIENAKRGRMGSDLEGSTEVELNLWVQNKELGARRQDRRKEVKRQDYAETVCAFRNGRGEKEENPTQLPSLVVLKLGQELESPGDLIKDTPGSRIWPEPLYFCQGPQEILILSKVWESLEHQLIDKKSRLWNILLTCVSEKKYSSKTI